MLLVQAFCNSSAVLDLLIVIKIFCMYLFLLQHFKCQYRGLHGALCLLITISFQRVPWKESNVANLAFVCGVIYLEPKSNIFRFIQIHRLKIDHPIICRGGGGGAITSMELKWSSLLQVPQRWPRRGHWGDWRSLASLPKPTPTSTGARWGASFLAALLSHTAPLLMARPWSRGWRRQLKPPTLCAMLLPFCLHLHLWWFRRAQNITKDYSHPCCEMFTLLPSGRHYWAIEAPTTRLTFFIPSRSSGFSSRNIDHMNCGTHALGALVHIIYI